MQNDDNQALRRCNPSETALTQWLAPHLNRSDLQEIAGANYGIAAQENLEGLLRLHQGEPMPTPLPVDLLEVLGLVRWSEPDDPEYRYCVKGRQGHRIRAFCCAILLRADDPQTQSITLSEMDTLIQMVASVLPLGRDAAEAALRSLCWRNLRLPDENAETAFFALATLLLRASLFQPNEDPEDLNLLAAWASSTIHRTLAGLTDYGLRYEVWSRLTQELLIQPAVPFPVPTATALREAAGLLMPL